MIGFERYRSIIDDFDAFEDACRTPLPRTIWHNHIVCSQDTFLDWLGGRLDPLTWCEGAFHVKDLNRERYFKSYLAGLFHVQEAVSMLPVRLLDPRPGWNILDLCAAPGNKTAQAALKVRNGGTVVANDLNRSRSGIIQLTLDRLSIDNVVVTASDARFFPDPGYQFDAVIADVPCSCEGATRKYPEAFSPTNTRFRNKIILRQRQILERAIMLCRPGGYVVYSTCTYAPDENEGVVSHVLENTPVGRETKIVAGHVPGLIAAPGISQWKGQIYHPDIGRTLRIWPHLQDTGGFYAALLQRSPSAFVKKTDSSKISAPDYPTSDFLPEDAEWFGIDKVIRTAYLGISLSTKSTSLVDSRVIIPASPRVIAGGVRAINTRGSTPRLSTAGARLLGPSVNTQSVTIPLLDVARYFSRKSTEVDVPGNVQSGKVVVRCSGITLGLGLLLRPGKRSVLESLFPKSFGGISASSVFEEQETWPADAVDPPTEDY